MPTQQLKKTVPELERKQYPVKILQFGSGNFLRGFADWMVQVANEKTGFNAGISVVQSISNSKTLHQQEGVYTVVLKGICEEETEPYSSPASKSIPPTGTCRQSLTHG